MICNDSKSSFKNQQAKKFTRKIANKPLIFDFSELKYSGSYNDDFAFF